MIEDEKKFITVPKVDYDKEQEELNNLRKWYTDNSFTIMTIVHYGNFSRQESHVYVSGNSNIPGYVPSGIQEAISTIDRKIREIRKEESDLRKNQIELYDRERQVQESVKVPAWIRWFFK